jgi:hypothetical protein
MRLFFRHFAPGDSEAPIAPVAPNGEDYLAQMRSGIATICEEERLDASE